MENKLEQLFEKISRKCKGKKLVKTAMSVGGMVGIGTIPLFMAPKPKGKVTSIVNDKGEPISMKKLINLKK